MANKNVTTAAHLEIARRRGRGLMAAEAAGSQPYEVLHAASAARDGAIIVLALWAMLHATGHADLTVPVLATAAVVVGIYGGVANGLAVAAQLRHWAHELERERGEIRDFPEQEREELKAIYEAKGFSGQQLESIVDTLCSDEDRLLRVMMEEEMGIFFEQWNHPAIIGIVTGTASVLGGLAVTWAASSSVWWLPIAATAGVLALAAMVRTGWGRRETVESFARWVIVAGGVAGTAYFLSKLIVEATA